MGISFNCKCPERRRPVENRRWGVLQRRCNHSAFNGYHRTISDYSTVTCLECLAIGRTKAGFVSGLPDVTLTSSGYEFTIEQPNRIKLKTENENNERHSNELQKPNV